MGLDFCWLSVEVSLIEKKNALGSSCLVELGEGDPFPLQGIQV